MTKAKKTTLAVACIFLIAIGVLAGIVCIKNDLDAQEQAFLDQFKSEKGKTCASAVLFAKGQRWEIAPDSAFVSQVLDALPSRMILQNPDPTPPQFRLSVEPKITIHLVSKSGGEISIRLYQGPMDVFMFDGKKRDFEGHKVWRPFSPNIFFTSRISDVVKARRGLDWDVPPEKSSAIEGH